MEMEDDIETNKVQQIYEYGLPALYYTNICPNIYANCFCHMFILDMCIASPIRNGPEYI